MTPPRSSLHALIALATLVLLSAPAVAQRSTPLDVVLVGGRVLDPETGLDAVRHVGIRGGRITVVTSGRTIPVARDTVDVRGLVVAPGFIDLHAHGQDAVNYEFLARDGVTTALELEIGTYPVAPWYAKRDGRALINFGVSVGHPGARRAMLDTDSTAEGVDVITADGRFVRESIEPARLSALEDRLTMGIRDGALGIGMGINYTPAATREEIHRAFSVAARQSVPVFAHLRSGGLSESAGGIAGVQEVIADAAATGASLHVVHVTSMGLGATPILLDLINGARARGVDVTTEAYPYTAGATYLQSALFEPGFEQRMGITYSDILWPATGERLTAETFAKYRKEGGLAVIFMIPEAAVDRAYLDANVMVASDGWFAIVNDKPVGHPRTAGTHARVLGRFVRERKVLSLMDAVRKMTLLPARRLESVDPGMRRKGRVQVGADGDLTVFDPARVIDVATFENPTQYSVGIVHVLVSGTFVVRGEQLVSGVAPGRAVRGSGAARSGTVSRPLSLAFTQVTVIDGTSSRPRRAQTGIVRGNRIVSVAPSRSAPIPADARIVDGRGKFLIPGLWDMHVHTAVVGGREVLPLYVANGVTGVRDMAGDWATLTAFREAIASGRLVGPRILASGPYLEGGDVPIPHILARTPDEGRAAVDSLVRLGVDFVKVHTQLTRDSYFAIARRARERGITFAGHVPRVVGSEAASDSGQRSIEHLLAIPVPCTPAESIAVQPRFSVQGALGRCSSQDLAPLYARFVRNDTWVTPTFVAQYEIAAWPGRAVPGDSLARYLPDSLRRYVAQIFPMPDSIPPGADSVGRAMFAKRLAQVAAMHRAGVRVLTGTDAPLRNSPPGFGLHEELVLLARGGLSPFEILRAATLEPARYLGALDSLGTIAPGKLADLVLLDANPLLDIRNTRRIAAVVANGRLYDAKDRDRLLRSGMPR
jgi:imidazolonepropionase-like amidohydrolase